MLIWFWSFDSIGGEGYSFQPKNIDAGYWAGSYCYSDVTLDDGTKDKKLEAFIYVGF